MTFNNEIQPGRVNITDMVRRMRDEDLFVDRSFQRRLVWTNKQQVRLIETILMDYPMPEIYIWEQTPDEETGRQRSSIVDGQQRLTTIRQFINNQWILKKNFLDPDHRDADYVGKFWKDLSADLKNKIYQYNINVRRIPSYISQEEIRLIFARLNETDRSLNPQELRNATLNGKFLEFAEKIADSDVLKRMSIFTANDIRRMKDVEFSSQLLGYERRGIADDTPESMNDLYDTYSDSYSDAQKDLNSVLSRLEKIENLFEDGEIKSFFETQNNIYTLNALLDIEPTRSGAEWMSALRAFVQVYRASSDDLESLDQEIAAFRKGASSRTLSKSSRTLRIFSLRNWLRTYLKEPLRDVSI